MSNNFIFGTSTLGSWRIKNDRIGIPNRGDIHLAGDQWIRLKQFDGEDYNDNGFASRNIWAAVGNSYLNNIRMGSWSTLLEGPHLVFRNDNGYRHAMYNNNNNDL
jgi:hypothetical protein